MGGKGNVGPSRNSKCMSHGKHAELLAQWVLFNLVGHEGGATEAHVPHLTVLMPRTKQVTQMIYTSDKPGATEALFDAKSTARPVST